MSFSYPKSNVSIISHEFLINETDELYQIVISHEKNNFHSINRNQRREIKIFHLTVNLIFFFNLALFLKEVKENKIKEVNLSLSFSVSLYVLIVMNHH